MRKVFKISNPGTKERKKNPRTCLITGTFNPTANHVAAWKIMNATKCFEEAKLKNVFFCMSTPYSVYT
jgi:hypothetical protein